MKHAHFVFAATTALLIASCSQTPTPMTAGNTGSTIAKPLTGDVPHDPGCTYTHGYWKNHTSKWPRETLIQNVQVPSDDTPFFRSVFGAGATWLSVMQSPTGGNANLILAQQYVAAKLNIYNGTYYSLDTIIIVEKATAYFSGTRTATRRELIAWSEYLTQYNEGLLAPGPCD